MKTLNVLLIAGSVLLLTCGTVLASPFGYQNANGVDQNTSVETQSYDPNTTPDATAPVPEPATMLLLGSGLVALGVGARKMKK